MCADTFVLAASLHRFVRDGDLSMLDQELFAALAMLLSRDFTSVSDVS